MGTRSSEKQKLEQMWPSPQDYIWKEKPKENLLAQKQITYSGELLHFEQQGKCKMAIQAKIRSHL